MRINPCSHSRAIDPRITLRSIRATKRTSRSASQLLEQRLGAGDFRLAGLLLDVEAFDDAVFHQHGIALRAQAEPDGRAVEGHVERLGEFRVAVGQATAL